MDKICKGYCMRCRKPCTIQSKHKQVTKNGKITIQGTCQSCNGKVSKFCSGGNNASKK